MKSALRAILKQAVSPFKWVAAAGRARYHERYVPLDHFYSPMIVFNDENRTKHKQSKKSKMLDINFEQDYQLEFLAFMQSNSEKIPWKSQVVAGLKYKYSNAAFCHHDAITYLNVLLKFKPKKVIEVGSGHSSCVLFDVDSKFLGNSIQKTFIEPYPKLLQNLMGQDIKSVTLIDKKVEEVDVSIFEQLNKGDILFIDSTHVSKFGSDLNYIMFEILPRLKSGVVIHFHDIFAQLEYPLEWLEQGRCWNENYILRAFLMNNSAYRILYFNDMMGQLHSSKYTGGLSVALENLGGSIWLEKK